MTSSMRLHAMLALIVAVASATSACSVFRVLDDEPQRADCPPVDEGGECFFPSHAGFVAHAIESARGWPQLDGLPLAAGEVIPAFDAVAGQPTWIVPILSRGEVVAASRFLPHGQEVRLGEVALYQPPRSDIPEPGPGEELFLVMAVCGDPLQPPCLFQNYGWRMRPAS